MTSSSTSPSGITVSLNNVELWQKFYPDQEMIVTVGGRKLFPDLKYDVTGLDKDQLYCLYLYLERVNRYKYTFRDGKWEALLLGEKTNQVKKIEHHDGAKLGSHWMKGPVTFDSIRITNNKDNLKENCVLVHSMHKYQPVVIVKRHSDEIEEEFRLGMTDFHVVTSYQNHHIKELKKSHNKFSSGHLEKGKHTLRKAADQESRPRKQAKITSTVSQSGVQYPTPPPSTPPNFHHGMMGMGRMMATPPQAPPTFNASTPSPFGQATPMSTPPTLAQTPPTLTQTPPTYPGLLQPVYNMMAPTSNPFGHATPPPPTTSAQTTPPQATPHFYNQFYNNPYGMMYGHSMGNFGYQPNFNFGPNHVQQQNQGTPSPFDNFGFQGF